MHSIDYSYGMRGQSLRTLSVPAVLFMMHKAEVCESWEAAKTHVIRVRADTN